MNAYDRGYDSYFLGKWENENPYQPGTEEHGLWLRGFKKAKYDSKNGL
jgi:ribosome modulation factor